jgi:glycosyltransferase involved in cell wall biosynthesis
VRSKAQGKHQRLAGILAREDQPADLRRAGCIDNAGSRPPVQLKSRGSQMPQVKGKLLVLCQLFYPEMVSTGKLMTEISAALHKWGWEIDVVCAQPSALHEGGNPKAPPAIEYEGINIYRSASFGRHRGSLIGRLFHGLTFMLSAALWSLRRAGRYRGLVVSTNPPFVGLVGLLVKWLRGKPYVVVVHDVYPETAIRLGLVKQRSLIAWIWKKLSEFIARGAEGNIVIGRDMAKVISQKLGSGDTKGVHIVSNWSDGATVYPVPKSQNSFRKQYNPGNAFLVQYSGTIGRTHNVENVIEAAGILNEENILFQFIGDGHKKAKLQATVRHRGLTNVQFLPFQPMDALAQVLSAGDLALVCLASPFTGLSVPCKTYGILAAGVAVLAFMDAESEIGLTINETGCGLVLENPSGPEVARAILSLKSDPDRLREMGRRARETFQARYTLAHAAASYDRILGEVFLGS